MYTNTPGGFGYYISDTHASSQGKSKQTKKQQGGSINSINLIKKFIYYLLFKLIFFLANIKTT